MIFGLFRQAADDKQAMRLYSVIVAQARQAELYRDIGVPDTVEGRYEMLMLHAFLFMHRLKSEPESVRDAGQRVFDLMFTDMDRSLREMGVGDLTVPKKIKKMASAFYGRTAAYDSALESGDGELAAAIERNVFDGDSGDDPRARKLAAYVRSAAKALSEQATDSLIEKGPVFPAPETAA